MAINLSSGSASTEPDVIADINTTPLIDVMLVLLIILIITIPMQLHSVDLNLPAGTRPPVAIKPDVVRIDIAADNRVRWNGEEIALGAGLDAKLAAIAALGSATELHVRPDRHAAYKTVAAVMAAAQRLKVNKIGIAGQEQFID